MVIQSLTYYGLDHAFFQASPYRFYTMPHQVNVMAHSPHCHVFVFCVLSHLFQHMNSTMPLRHVNSYPIM